MRQLWRMVSVLLLGLLALGGTGSAVLAQDDEEASDPLSDFENMAGLETVIGRFYLYDTSDQLEAVDLAATPEAEIEVPDGMVAYVASIYAFDTADNAAATLEDMRDELTAEALGTDFSDVAPLAIDDFGDDTVAFSAVSDDEDFYGLTTWNFIVTQDEEYIYYVGGVGKGEDTDITGPTIDLLEAVIETDAGEGEPVFDETGASEGGLWDKFPAAGEGQFESFFSGDSQDWPVPAE